MEHSNHYYNLMSKARTRGWTKSTCNHYFEIHHVNPKSLCRFTNGVERDEYVFDCESESVENLVPLTFREHVVAHHLLTKMYPVQQMFAAYAAMRMTHNSHQIPMIRQLEQMKISNAKAASIRMSNNNVSTNPLVANKIATSTTEVWKNMSEEQRYVKQRGLRAYNETRKGYKFPGTRAQKTAEEKQRHSEIMTGKMVGEKHPKFKGWYVTPFGTFSSTIEASRLIGVGHTTVRNRCLSNSSKFKDWYFKPQ